MDKRHLILCALAICSASCVDRELTNELQPLVGKNISELVRRLGYPTNKQDMLGQHVYNWVVDYQAGDMRPMCTLHVGTDPNDVVLSYSWEGNLVGCDAIRRRLDQ